MENTDLSLDMVESIIDYRIFSDQRDRVSPLKEGART